MSALAAELEEFIQHTVPKSTPVQKYGGTLFTLRPEEKEGQFCGVFMYKNHVQISFSKGAELPDPGMLLCGTGKKRRHLNFSELSDIDNTALKVLVKHASQL